MTGHAASRADPRLALLLDSATPFCLPLSRPFRGVTVREGLLLRGPSGWGEFAPFPEYDVRVASRWLSAAVEAAFGSWPEPRRESIPVNAIIPAVTASVAADLTAEAVALDGCTTIKVKVAQAGETLADDVARVAAVRDALTAAGVTSGQIRVDANAAWTVAEAIAAIEAIASAADGLEYVEQPCRSLPELAAVGAAVETLIAADESIRFAANPAAAVRAGNIDIAVIKVPPLGGVRAALAVADAVGIPVVVSGAMDSSVGLAPGLALAAALPESYFACGLGTGSLLAADVIDFPVRPTGGRLSVTRTDPDPAALLAASARMSTSRQAWWRRRLEMAWSAGANQYCGDLVAAAL